LLGRGILLATTKPWIIQVYGSALLRRWIILIPGGGIEFPRWIVALLAAFVVVILLAAPAITQIGRLVWW
jgi:hypothetical protein